MVTARTLTDADVEAVAEAIARKLRGEPSPAPVPRRRDRKRRVASAEMHELVAKKNQRYAGPGRC